MEILGLVLIGLASGIISGFLGIGGATILIPALIILYKLTQHSAQGTSLAAMLLPVGILAAMRYWQAGNVNVKFAALLAVGFLIGGYFGAAFAQPVSEPLLRKIFGVYLLIIAMHMLFW
ncbi:MAG: sulfite exporter TauE/SafE family protein [Candidatus Margulisbacteria bacterium]|nr:sulfite exporter TauE/SafE family protein [Candidatus Margulisiibacteriota bacterium]